MEFVRSKSKMKNPQLFSRRRQPPPPPQRPRNLSMCKKHPKHQQSPGVCSVCLNEKLKQLSAASSSRSTTTAESSCSSSSLSSLSSSSHYSASASSNSSPLHHRHYRIRSDGKEFSMTLFKSGKNMLTKSRSVAFITRWREAGRGHETDGDDKKKEGFWSKLLRPGRSKKVDSGGLAHSRTMNGRMSSEVH